MYLTELFIPKFVTEGGSIFDDVKGVPQKYAAAAINNLKAALPRELRNQMFSTGSAGHKAYSHDIDIMLDNAAVEQWSKSADPRTAKSILKQAIEAAGLQCRLNGVSIHVRVPLGQNFVQADILLVDNAAAISRLHQHDYATMGNVYNGADKHILLSSIAKAVRPSYSPMGLMWSPFQGLYTRGTDGKKGELVAQEPGAIAKLLLNPHATVKDLASPQSIVAAIPIQERAAKLAAAQIDFAKNKKPLP